MNWQQLCQDPTFQDLPYKIELNEQGQIIMSPTGLIHGKYQFKIGSFILKLMRQTGEVITECAIQTTKGTKVADVAWFSSQRWDQVKDKYDSPIAPEICIEILSPSNTAAEMRTKRLLYLAAGAQEVWFCNEEGHLSFYDTQGKLPTSRLIPDFPKKMA